MAAIKQLAIKFKEMYGCEPKYISDLTKMEEDLMEPMTKEERFG